MRKDTVVYLKFRRKADSVSLPRQIIELASRKYAMNDGHWVVQFNGEVMSKVAALLRNDELFEALQKERDVDIIFDMPIYFKSNKVSKTVKISNSIIKYVTILKAKLELSIYLTK
jgi:hypothetical protein